MTEATGDLASVQGGDGEHASPRRFALGVNVTGAVVVGRMALVVIGFTSLGSD